MLHVHGTPVIGRPSPPSAPQPQREPDPHIPQGDSGPLPRSGAGWEVGGMLTAAAAPPAAPAARAARPLRAI